MSTYEVDKNEDHVRIINTPAGPSFPYASYFSAIGFTIACFYFGFAYQNFLMVLAVLLMLPVGIGAVAMPLFWLKWRIKGRPCGKTEIIINASRLSVTDASRGRSIISVDLDDVISFSSTNSMRNEPLTTMHWVLGVDKMVAGLNTVMVNAKGRKYCIACGMTEAGAEGLIHELTRDG